MARVVHCTSVSSAAYKPLRHQALFAHYIGNENCFFSKSKQYSRLRSPSPPHLSHVACFHPGHGWFPRNSQVQGDKTQGQINGKRGNTPSSTTKASATKQHSSADPGGGGLLARAPFAPNTFFFQNHAVFRENPCLKQFLGSVPLWGQNTAGPP